MADPYTILGVSKTASEKEVKSAYRKLAKQLHPDRNKDNPNAAERFSEVTRAYDLLSDAEQRARFDRGEIDMEGNPANPFAGMGGGFRGGAGGDPRGGFRQQDFRGFGGAGPGGTGGGEEVDIGDLFEGLFGGAARGGGRGGFGGAQPGGGFRQPPPQKGADIAYRLRVPFTDAATLAKQRITLSDGKTIDLTLPAGVEDGTQMRLKGKGDRGPGGAGDGIVTIAIDRHPFFERDGDDVRLDLPVTLSEAVAGGKIRVPTVDGAVMLTIKPGIDGGTTMRLGGKGFHRKGGGRGDQLVRIEIALPKDLSDLAKRLEGWQDASDPRKGLTG